MRAQAYDFATFGETFLPLKEPAPDIENEQPISFVVSFYDLDIAGAAVDGEVRMTYRPEQKRVNLMSGNFERPLVALPVEKFTDFGAAKIGAIDPTSRHPIDPALLKRAIRYVGPAVEEDHLLEWPSVLELRGGRMMGGNQRAIAVFTAAKLNGLGIRIRRPFIDSVAAILPMLDGEAALFETPNFYIIRDRSTAFGFEKPRASFPNIDFLLAPHPGRDRVAFVRQTFINAMATLETWLKDYESRPYFRFGKGGPAVRCIFSAQGKDGKKIEISIKGHRFDYPEDPVGGFFFPTSLRRAAESHEAQFLSIDLYSERNIAIVSEKSVWEGCDAQTLIGVPPGPKTDFPAFVLRDLDE